MVQTYFLTVVFVFVFLGGIMHCRSYRMRTEVECNDVGCTVTKLYGGVVGCGLAHFGHAALDYHRRCRCLCARAAIDAPQVELEQTITRAQLIGAAAVRMDEGEVQDIKGLKKRAIQRLDYGASIKYRAETGPPEFPERDCVMYDIRVNHA